MSTNFDDKLLNWLNEQGYPLEMAVARLCRQFGFRAIQSDYYTDPETNNQREIDVLAYKQRIIDDVLARVSINFECKNSKDKPWVIFSSPDIKLAHPARIIQRAGSKLAIQFLKLLSQEKDIQDLPLFSLPQKPGYGITHAFSTWQDIPYTACMGAAKSALATASSADNAAKHQGSLFDIIFPVVVIEGKLFECYLNDDNRPVVEEMKSGVLVWRNPVVGMPHTIINILTLDGLSSFLQDASKSIDILFSRSSEIHKLTAMTNI